MKFRPLFLAGVLASSFWFACNCGHIGGGLPCTTTADCPAGEACSSGTCSTGDGGTGTGTGTDGGGTGGNTDGGGGGGGGGGTDGGGGGGGGGTDGGLAQCANLQCQQQPWITCPANTTTTLTGKVYDPAGAVPLYNATVYVPNSALKAFTPGINCDACGAQTSGSPIAITLTGPDGSFQLKNVPAGQNIPLVIQIGRWRRQVTIPSVPACATTSLTDASVTRLPRSQAEGDIPLIAIATGNADPFECLLRKMGIADTEFTTPTNGGRVHFYVSNGADLANDSAPAMSTLVDDLNTLKKYDVVILPCEGGEILKTATETQNIIDYTAQGGRMFTTHYGYVWIAKAQQPFPSTAVWAPDPQQNKNPPSPITATLNTGFPKGQAFSDWLTNVGAQSPTGGAGKLDLLEMRNDLTAPNPPISTGWMSVAYTKNKVNYTATPHITFNTPVNPGTTADGGTAPQCGRVVFSDFHVSASALTGQANFPPECKVEALSPQEKALEFMLFDLSSCVQKDDTAPQVCAPEGSTCKADADCCGGLSCLDAVAAPCSGGAGCSCGITFK